MLMHKRSKYFSMNKKLMFLLVPIFLLVSTLAVYICCHTFNQVIVSRTTEIIQNNVSSNVALMDTFLQSTLTELDAIQNCIKNSYLTEAQQKSLYQNIYGTSDYYPEGLYYADSEGKYFDGTDAEILRDYSAEELVWFQEGMLHTDGFAYGNISYDQGIGKEVVTASKNVSVGPFKRVVAANVPLQVYQDYINEVSFFDHQGYTLLLDLSSYQIIGESNNYKDSINQNEAQKQEYTQLIDTLISNLKQNGNDKSRSLIQCNGYYVVIDYLQEANWAIIGFVSELDAVISETIKIVLEVCIPIAIILVISVLAFGLAIHRITGKLKTITEYIRTISNGDFTSRLELKSRDEIGIMVEALSRLIAYLSSTFTKMNKAGQTLTVQSDNSNELSKKLLDSSTTQNHEMKEMLGAVTRMRQSVETIAATSGELGTRVNDVEGQSSDLHQVMQDCMAKTDQGKEQMQQVDASVSKIDDTMNELQESMMAVSDGMKNIDALSNILDEISSKSKLLALNAAIEAARSSAGDNGFGVVADEMGNLSNISADSVVKIKDIIVTIENLVQNMLVHMKKSIRLTKDCCDSTKATSDSFEGIMSAVSYAKEKVDHVDAHMQVLSQMSNTLMGITQEQLATSQEFEAISDHVMQQAEFVQSNAVTCENEAVRLREVVTQLENMLVGILYQAD